MTPSPQNWVALLDITQFCYNLHNLSTTKMTPFEIVSGKQCMTPLDVPKTTSGNVSSSVHGCKGELEMFSQAQDNLCKAQRRMKKHVDKNHHSVNFNVVTKCCGNLLHKLGNRFKVRLGIGFDS